MGAEGGGACEPSHVTPQIWFSEWIQYVCIVYLVHKIICSLELMDGPQRLAGWESAS